jgi:hypothetical protein
VLYCLKKKRGRDDGYDRRVGGSIEHAGGTSREQFGTFGFTSFPVPHPLLILQHRSLECIDSLL